MGNIEELLRKRKELLESIDRQITQSFSKAVTLMFTDIVGSTRYFENVGDIAGRQMIQTHNDLLFPIVEEYGGRIIKTIGDSIMASFEDPQAGVDCAVSMQQALKKHNKDQQDPIEVRMGLHYGQAVVDEKDLFGDMVNTSARVESRAEGQEILISGKLQAQIKPDSHPLVHLGSDYVKGKKEKIDFFLVNWNARDAKVIERSWSKRTSGSEIKEKSPTSKKQKVVIRGNIDLKKASEQIKALSNKGNPYLNRVMIPHPDLFFGRTGTVKRIFQRISAERPQSVSLVGERRIGKSSLLNFLFCPRTRLEQLEQPEPFLFLFIDFQQLRSIDVEQFFSVLFSELEKQLQGFLELSLSNDFAGMRFLCDALTEKGFKLIFLFDEFECITKNEKIGADFYSLLRSLANNYPLAFVTASGRNLKDMCLTHEISDSPFFNIFAAQNLGLFREKEAYALITDPSKQCGVSLEPLTKQILSLGGLYPFFLQMACASWYDYLESEELEAKEFQNVPREVLEFFRQEAEPHFEYIAETLGTGERDVIKQVLQNVEFARFLKSFF